MIEALTYDEILTKMKERFKQESGFEADDASDIGIRLRLLAGQLFSQSADISFMSRQLFLQTATGEYLNMHAQMRGISRREATKAHGIARFFTMQEEHENITIPKGTLCAIPGEDKQRYVTSKEAVLLQGKEQVDVPIIAMNSGKSGNAAVGAITMLVNPPQDITAVSNITVMTGGSAQESDDLLRERIIQSYQKMSNGANLQYYKEIALQNPRVISANVVSAGRGPGTVDVIFETAEENEEEVEKIKKELDATFEIAREIGKDVKAFECWPRCEIVAVHIKVRAGFDNEEVIEQCKKEIAEYIDSLAVGEEVLRSKIGNIIYNIEGIENYELIAPAWDLFVSGDCKFFYSEIYVLDIL